MTVFHRMVLGMLQVDDICSNQYGIVAQGTYNDIGKAQSLFKRYDYMTSLDIENAFNSVQWPHLEQEMVRCGVHPGVIEYVMCFVRNRKHEDIDIQGGIPQGDPLSSKLFAIAINHSLRRITAKYPNTIAYLDDVDIYHDNEHVIHFANDIISETGLRLNTKKCKRHFLRSERPEDAYQFMQANFGKMVSKSEELLTDSKKKYAALLDAVKRGFPCTARSR